MRYVHIRTAESPKYKNHCETAAVPAERSQEELSNCYNLKEEMKEIIKEYGGKNFFNELNAARIPFFFAAAVENTEEKTEYLCESITPNAMGIRLADDKFADFLDIRNHGFVTIPSFDAASHSTQGLKLLQETGKNRQTFYSDEALLGFAKGQGIPIEAGAEPDDEDMWPESDGLGVSRGIVDSVICSVIDENTMPSGQKGGESNRIPVPVCCGEIMEITWGGSHFPHKNYEEEFAKIDERHKGILKGDGSFLKAKEQEAMYYNIRQLPQPAPEEGGAAEGKSRRPEERRI